MNLDQVLGQDVQMQVAPGHAVVAERSKNNTIRFAGFDTTDGRWFSQPLSPDVEGGGQSAPKNESTAIIDAHDGRGESDGNPAQFALQAELQGRKPPAVFLECR